MSIARFWRETPQRYNLGGAKCTNCGSVYFPPRSVCPSCTQHRQSLGKLVPFQLSGEGEVVTYTIVQDAAQGFEMQVPYVLAIVRTAEGPRLTGQVVDVDPKQMKVGLKVRTTFRKLREEGKAGVIHYGYKFFPADEPPTRPAPRAPKEGVPTAPVAGAEQVPT